MTRVHRIEVRPRKEFGDPRAERALHDFQSAGAPVHTIEVADVYLIESALSEPDLSRIAQELLADAVTQETTIGALPSEADAMIEIHPLPGVMDPDAEAVQGAIRAMLGAETRVSTGRRYDVSGVSREEARSVTERLFANSVIHAIHEQPYHPKKFPTGHKADTTVRSVKLLGLSDPELTRLAREAHLFLSLEEMKAIQAHYQKQGRDPREIELETIAQTWSEHCVHKTLKATIRYTESGSSLDFAKRPGHTKHADGSITIDNLLKSTIAAATHELIADGLDWCLSVFVDNAGVIAFDDTHAVCFKVETHNHPSAIEPYGGAATGIGGCIRDIIGTGLAAKPIAATDVFCGAHPDLGNVPNGCLHPMRVLKQVVAGVRDYGNRMGIPTLNGLVWFDDNYVGNPLVYCGCIGVMPRDKVGGGAKAGDVIVVLGGRTGRDGIHGATFSSAELTDTHADEFSHAVQIGNAVTEKKVLDAILEARDHESGCLYNAITDCGAGGFSSAVGEMGAELGAEVHLDRAPLKYEGLTPTEIWISEAQERMVLAVPPGNLATLREIAALHEVEMCELGTFGAANRALVLNDAGKEVGRLSMEFLHEGLPKTTREATWAPVVRATRLAPSQPPVREALLALLKHPNIASKRWIIRQYDHEVQGGTVLKPLVGVQCEGPGDAAVITPVHGSTRGLAIGCGLATNFRDDPYVMALAAVDECVRNLVCVGADPERIAILDNFCWPSCQDPQNLGSLVRAAEGCYDAAKAYRTPFISGKDSLNNQFTPEGGRTIQIPPTLLISGMGIVTDVQRCVTMDAKRAGSVLVLVGAAEPSLRGSHYELLFGTNDEDLPQVDLQDGPWTAQGVARAIATGIVHAAHDVSDGGLLVAVVEMCMAGGLGFVAHSTFSHVDWFSEGPSRYVLEVFPDDLQELKQALAGVPHTIVGRLNTVRRLIIPRALEIDISELIRAWKEPLDW